MQPLITLVCDGTTNCAKGRDEADCCKRPGEFQCPINKLCMSAALLCDGWDHCADGADESAEICSQAITRRMAPSSDKKAFMILIVATMITIFSIVYFLQFCRTRFGKNRNEPKYDQSSDPLSPLTLSKSQRVSKIASVAYANTLTLIKLVSPNHRQHRLLSSVEAMRWILLEMENFDFLQKAELLSLVRSNRLSYVSIVRTLRMGFDYLVFLRNQGSNHYNYKDEH
uniref:Uncharacterized protein n=1 Tax=Glossina brevipalpis TaxID=37001 RepID=A0A1A9WDX4_9MUSC